MSLATRCTACGTVFRVVQDQLKVSEGWVRCGRCNEVFNALEGLFDLERDVQPDWSSPSWAPTQPDGGPDSGSGAALGPESLRGAFDEVGGADEPHDPALVDRIDEHLFGPRRADPHRRPVPDVDDRDRLEFADARLDSEPIEDAALLGAIDGHEAGAAASTTEVVAADDPVLHSTDFMRRADREARWQRPAVRAMLGAATLLLVGALGLQVANQHRDLIAARWPEAQPVLQQWCDIAACRIEPLRRIEDITVESTALTRIGVQADAFRLSVALRNRGELPLALPSIDLSLTDAGGLLVARRALAPQDFRVASATIAPGSESALQLQLSAGSPRVSGYTVEIFYP